MKLPQSSRVLEFLGPWLPLSVSTFTLAMSVYAWEVEPGFARPWLVPALLFMGGLTIAGLLYLLRQLLLRQADLAEARAALETETRQRRSAESDLQRMASIDELTGIPNRNFFIENLVHSLQVSARQHHQLALIVLDLDRFQVLNDSLGHGFGDQLLIQVADRLSKLACPEVMIAHSSGDEFLLFLEQVDSLEDVIELVTGVQRCLEPSFCIDGESHKITGSMGVAVFPEGGNNAEALLRNADAALFQAKESGRNSFQFYAAGMHQRALDRLQLEKDLHLALERDEFILYMQPQLNLADGRQSSVEALIRWQHPTRGLVPPLEFIPAAEESGLIIPIGRWVLENACRHLRSWRGTALDHMSIAINLSGRELASPDLLEAVSGMLTRYAVDPSRLKIELTEEIFIDNIEHNMDQLLRLDQLGLQLAIDDFGVGYSSLAYLRNFPVSLVKIDRSFIAHVVERPNDAVIVRAVINLAHNLGIPVIAEGIETQAQLDFLRDNHCDLIQGYFTGRPMPAKALLAHVSRTEENAYSVETSQPSSGLTL